jgi:Tfp pilus assembly protein PilF
MSGNEGPEFSPRPSNNQPMLRYSVAASMHPRSFRLSQKQKNVEQATTPAKGPTWLQTLALLFVFGLIVFAVTRQMYVGDAQADAATGSDTASPSAMPQGDQLEMNTALLESLLSFDSKKKDPATMSLLANKYFANKQYAEAADLYAQLSVLDPGNVDIQNNLGLTLHYINQSEEALAVLKKGSALNPDNQRIWLTLGYVNKALGNLDEAKLSLETAEQIDPDNDVGRSASKMLSEL